MNNSGRLWKANCPFHEEKTPSFIVDEAKQRWHCFGACNIGGDGFEFIKQHERCEFIDALKICAEIAGINLTLNENSEKKEYLEKFYSINEMAAKFFVNILQSPAGNEFKKYLENRHLELSSIAEWKMPEYRTRICYVPQYPVYPDETVEESFKRVFMLKANQNKFYTRE